MSNSCTKNTEDMSNNEEIRQLMVDIALLKDELNKKTNLLKKKQVAYFS